MRDAHAREVMPEWFTPSLAAELARKAERARAGSRGSLSTRGSLDGRPSIAERLYAVADHQKRAREERERQREAREGRESEEAWRATVPPSCCLRRLSHVSRQTSREELEGEGRYDSDASRPRAALA